MERARVKESAISYAEWEKQIGKINRYHTDTIFEFMEKIARAPFGSAGHEVVGWPKRLLDEEEEHEKNGYPKDAADLYDMASAVGERGGYYLYLLREITAVIFNEINKSGWKAASSEARELWVQLFRRALDHYNFCVKEERKRREREGGEVEVVVEEVEDGISDFVREEFDFRGSEILGEDMGVDLVQDLIDYSGSLGVDGTREMIIEALKTLPAASLTRQAARALSELGADESVQELLRLLRAPETDKYDQAMYSRILYLMELGKIGVHESVVKYFEYEYHLRGKKGKDVAGAMRITGDGKIGLFGKTGELLGYFELGDLKDPETRRQAEILEVTRELLFASPDTPDDIRRQFLKDYTYFYEKVFGKEGTSAGVRLSDLTLREQVWLFTAANNPGNQETGERLLGIGRKFGIEGVRLFAAMEQDRNAGQKVMDLAERLSQEDFSLLARKYSELFDLAEAESGEIALELRVGQSPEARLVVFEALMVRAKDIIADAYLRIVEREEDPQTVAAEVVRELSKESRNQKAASGLFRKTAELLKDKPPGSVDLRRLAKAQEAIAGQADGRAVYLRALQARGELKPVPEIFWTVDRTLDEYQSRLGFDVAALLQTLGRSPQKKLLLELGPGNGRSKDDRAKRGIPDVYTDLSLADSLYYPLSDFIYNLLDWQMVEKICGQPITESDRQNLADLIYKVLVINDGETEKMDFAYCENRLKKLTTDPQEIGNLLREAALLIGTTVAVPTDYSEIDGGGKRVYPRQKRIADMDNAPGFRAARLALSDPAQMALCLRQMDRYEDLPAYPEGVMVSDFTRLDCLKDGQLDVALGVRSTVYLQGEDYNKFMLGLAAKLNTGGIYVDDNVRENFGVRYRLGELRTINEEWQSKYQARYGALFIHIIMGPGVEGEDAGRGSVPKAVVFSKNGDHSSLIRSLLNEGCQIYSLEELLPEVGEESFEIAA